MAVAVHDHQLGTGTNDRTRTKDQEYSSFRAREVKTKKCCCFVTLQALTEGGFGCLCRSLRLVKSTLEIRQ
ncbi:hypothetical protein M407DRAFT_167919 [Tulasnella calospora MUT 4182]|uniref:Uncharacterized protein n=1 Tax=Tulasnella calospora MUT 4182 TaxID=1051891 RepID=A0A0C3Q3P5_9AGAM|nr:hypothetical protein M407DRAFT_167919 [Tulasnella calospora MUT 4182]